VKYFVVGAVIFWALTKAAVDDLGDHSFLLLPLSVDEKHARLALHFLESAAASGCNEALLEMYKAHVLPAKEMKRRAPLVDDFLVESDG